MDPGDKVHLQLGVLAGVHLVQLVGQLENELVVLNLERLVGAGVGEADGETHGTVARYGCELLHDHKCKVMTRTPSPGIGSLQGPFR